MLNIILEFYDLALEALNNGAYISEVEKMPVRDRIARSKNIPEDELNLFDEISANMKEDFKKLESKGGTVDA